MNSYQEYTISSYNVLIKWQVAQETCWEMMSLRFALTFLSAVSRLPLPASHTQPLHCWVAVGPFSHHNCLGGDSHVWTETQWHPQTQGTNWAFKGPCGLGWHAASTFLSENEVVRPLTFKGPFGSGPSVTEVRDPTALHNDRMEVGLSSHWLFPLQGCASCSPKWFA